MLAAVYTWTSSPSRFPCNDLSIPPQGFPDCCYTACPSPAKISEQQNIWGIIHNNENIEVVRCSIQNWTTSINVAESHWPFKFGTQLCTKMSKTIFEILICYVEIICYYYNIVIRGESVLLIYIYGYNNVTHTCVCLTWSEVWITR